MLDWTVVRLLNEAVRNFHQTKVIQESQLQHALTYMRKDWSEPIVEKVRYGKDLINEFQKVNRQLVRGDITHEEFNSIKREFTEKYSSFTPSVGTIPTHDELHNLQKQAYKKEKEERDRRRQEMNAQANAESPTQPEETATPSYTEATPSPPSSPAPTQVQLAPLAPMQLPGTANNGTGKKNTPIYKWLLIGAGLLGGAYYLSRRN